MEATPRGTSQRTRFKFDKAMPKAKSYATTYTAAGIGDLLDFLHPHLTGQCVVASIVPFVVLVFTR